MEEEKVLETPEVEDTEKKQPVEIANIALDFDALEAWRREGEKGLPVYSMLSFYEACGMQQRVKDYYDEYGKDQFAPLDVVACNFYTLQRIKNLITDNWELYSMVIVENNRVEWDTRKWAPDTKHYRRKLRPRVRNSLNYDFANFCPAIDDDLPDNTLVFRVIPREKKETPVETIEVPEEKIEENETVV